LLVGGGIIIGFVGGYLVYRRFKSRKNVNTLIETDEG
jgi:hypothetical protein